MSDVLVLQITMLLLILIGALVKKIGIISPTGQKNINDLVINLVLPCNIVKSFLIDFDHQILRQFALVLVISIAIQICSVIIGKVLYGKKEVGHRMSLQYGVICSNAGFLGNPVAEGVFGSIGLAMASIFLIPMRIMMWSSGIAIYTQSTDWKGTLKKVATHPCIIACFVGLILMLTQWQLPAVAENTIATIGNCNTALSMMVIGMILADANIFALFDREVLAYSLLRLLVMPVALYAVCLLLKVPALVTGRLRDSDRNARRRNHQHPGLQVPRRRDFRHPARGGLHDSFHGNNSHLEHSADSGAVSVSADGMAMTAAL